MNRHPPQNHQSKRERQRNQCNAATEHQRRKCIERKCQRDPREPECLDQPQHQLAPIMNYEKVVQIEKIERRQAEEGGHCGFLLGVLVDQLEVSVVRPEAQVDRADDCAVDERRLGDNQQDRSSVEA